MRVFSLINVFFIFAMIIAFYSQAVYGQDPSDTTDAVTNEGSVDETTTTTVDPAELIADINRKRRRNRFFGKK